MNQPAARGTGARGAALSALLGGPALVASADTLGSESGASTRSGVLSQKRATVRSAGPRLFVAPLGLVPRSSAGRVALALFVLALIGLLMLGIAALPPRIFRRTPLSPLTFIRARGFLAAAALSLLLSVALLYALGALQF